MTNISSPAQNIPPSPKKVPKSSMWRPHTMPHPPDQIGPQLPDVSTPFRCFLFIYLTFFLPVAVAGDLIDCQCCRPHQTLLPRNSYAQEISTCAEAFCRQIFERANETDQPQQHLTWPRHKSNGPAQSRQSGKPASQKIKSQIASRTTNPMAIHSLVNALFKYFATRMLTSGLSRWFVYTDHGAAGEVGGKVNEDCNLTHENESIKRFYLFT